MNKSFKATRIKKNILQRELAARVGTHPSVISLIENHSLIPGISTQKKLARALGCKVSKLFPE
ncbi:hypothetical protein ES705_11029 [subsurface metagenome]